MHNLDKQLLRDGRITNNGDLANSMHSCSLRGKQLYKVPAETVGNEDRVLAILDATRAHALGKVLLLFPSLEINNRKTTNFILFKFEGSNQSVFIIES